MDTTVAEFKLMLLNLLDDQVAEATSGDGAIAGTLYSSSLLYDSILAALDAILQKCWRPNIQELVPEEDDQTIFALPADLVDIEAVYVAEQGKFIPRFDMRVGATYTENIGNGWLHYPYGCVTFLTGLDADGATLYYSASWTKPEDDDDALEPPSYALTAMLFYSASYCMLAKSSSSGTLNQFKTRIDSGIPTNNPVADASALFLRRFEHAMQFLPLLRKGAS